MNRTLKGELRVGLTAITDLIKRKIPRKFRILQMICDCFHVFPSKREVFSLKDAILFWCCLPNVKSNFQLAKWRKKNIPFSDRFSQFWWSLTNVRGTTSNVDEKRTVKFELRYQVNSILVQYPKDPVRWTIVLPKIINLNFVVCLILNSF